MAKYTSLQKAVKAFQSGDSDAFRYIYDETNSNLYVYAKYIMKDESRAEELLQDTYLEIIKSIGNLKDPGAFKTWSKQIMFNLSRHAFEKSAREQQNTISRGDDDEELQIADLDRDYAPEECADANFVNRVVRDAIDRLPAEMSFVLVSHYLDGLKIREIAEITGDSENTIKSRLRLGRNKVKAMLEKYEKETDTKLLVAAPASLITTALKSIGADPSFLLPEGAGSTIFTHLAKAVSDAASAAGAAGTAGTGGAAGASGSAAGAAGETGAGGAASAGTASGEATGAATGSSAAKAAAGAAAAKAAKGGIAKKITALIIAACVGVGGGAAYMHFGNSSHKPVVTLTAAEKRTQARNAYSDYFEDYLQPERKKYSTWTGKNDITQIYTEDKDEDKIPDLFIYFPAKAVDYSQVSGDTDIDEYEADMKMYMPDYGNLKMCIYADGKVHNINSADYMDVQTMETEFQAYTSKNRKYVSLVKVGATAEAPYGDDASGLTSIYQAVKLKLENGKYVKVDEQLDAVSEGDEKFDDVMKKYMPKKYYKYAPFDEDESTGENKMIDLQRTGGDGGKDLEVANYLQQYGINILRTDTGEKDWKAAYKKFFSEEKNYCYQGSYAEGPYASNVVAVQDINGDGIPEVFVNSYSGGDPTSLMCRIFTFADGKVVCFGSNITGVDIFTEGNSFYVLGSYLPYLDVVSDWDSDNIRAVAYMPGRIYKVKVVDSGFLVTSMLQSESGGEGTSKTDALDNWKVCVDDSASAEVESRIDSIRNSDYPDVKWSDNLKSGHTYEYIEKQIEKY